jgi:predicted nucleotidyltransferase
MSEALDPVPLLRRLHERGIEHIVVGGFAVNAHGYIRVTKDLDIVPRPAAENLRKLADMLRDLDATILDTNDFKTEEMPADPTHAADLALGGNFCLLTDLGRLDVMQWLGGIDVEDLYTELAPGAIESSVDGVPVRVCGLDALLTMKRAAGRPQDLEDLKRLEIK